MELQINKNDTTIDVKAAFGRRYPGLKIEFFHKPHGEHEGSPRRDMIEDEVKLSELSKAVDHDQLHISSSMKVQEVEAAFEEKFGLHVQVFRKMGHIWIETTRTDHYSLKEQMTMSEESMRKI